MPAPRPREHDEHDHRQHDGDGETRPVNRRIERERYRSSCRSVAGLILLRRTANAARAPSLSTLRWNSRQQYSDRNR
jgi:hypothetical protein